MLRSTPRALRFRESFWLIPTLFSVGALLLSFLTIAIDEWLSLEGLGSEPLGYTGDPAGAQIFLYTVAGSIITVAGVSFSITIAVLAMASVQFGPRLIRNFVRDTGNQIVLGTFLATFIYCISVLRAVSSSDASVPYLSITACSLLTLASLGMLIYFISHVSGQIQVMNIIASIGDDLDETITRLFPEETEGRPREVYELASTVDPIFAGTFRPVAARRSGYIRAVTYERLVEIAAGHSMRIRVPLRPGQFIARGAALAEVLSDDGTLPSNHDVADAIAGVFDIADDRGSDQDIEYHIDQLVEVASRALSTAINDPFTAMACVDRLGASLRYLVRRQLPSAYLRDEQGTVRAVVKTETFPGALDAAFNLIRQHGHANVPVALRLIEVLAIIAEHTSDPYELQAIRRQAQMMEHSARQSMYEPADLEALEERSALVTRALEAPDMESI